MFSLAACMQQQLREGFCWSRCLFILEASSWGLERLFSILVWPFALKCFAVRMVVECMCLVYCAIHSLLTVDPDAQHSHENSCLCTSMYWRVYRQRLHCVQSRITSLAHSGLIKQEQDLLLLSVWFLWVTPALFTVWRKGVLHKWETRLPKTKQM